MKVTRFSKNLHSKSQLKPHEIIEAKAKLKKLAPEKWTCLKQGPSKGQEKRAPKVGDDIVVLSYGQRGTLTSQLKDGRWEAQVGLIKMTLKRKSLILFKPSKKTSQEETGQCCETNFWARTSS